MLTHHLCCFRIEVFGWGERVVLVPLYDAET